MRGEHKLGTSRASKQPKSGAAGANGAHLAEDANDGPEKPGDAAPPKVAAKKAPRPGQTASLKGGLTFGTTIHPYDGTDGGEASSTGTSIFDPVLCELAYLWFCPPGGRILDPFAGGSVRGIVAGVLGRAYTGVDLRPEQVSANLAQLGDIKTEIEPTWIVGDSQKLPSLVKGPVDFVFTCPPYGDLEVYSDTPADISTMDYPAFIAALRVILGHAIGMLKPDRFAAIVIGDFRDKKGFYRNFVSDTIAAMQDAGAKLYNEAILVTAIGSLSIRAGKQFKAGRKLGKTHQNVLVFLKGDAKKAVAACGPVVIPEMEMDPEGTPL